MCPRCPSSRISIIDCRPADNCVVRRRRECEDCGFRYSTYEISDVAFNAILRISAESGKAAAALKAAIAAVQKLASDIGGGE